MELPKKKSEINKSFKDQKFLMIGDAGVGKSEFFAQCPTSFFVEAEAGLNFVETFKLPTRSWEDTVGILKLLLSEKEDTFPYELVVVDTIDRIVDHAAEYVIAKMKQAYPNRAEKGEIQGLGDHPRQGVGWFTHRNLVKKFLEKLEEIPCAVAIIGHLEIKKIEEDGGKYDKATISIGGKVGGDILAWSDHTLHVKGVKVGDKTKRTIYTIPTKSREAKSRGGIIKNGWIWSEDRAENYKQLRTLFT